STFLPDEESFSLDNSDDPSLPHPPPEPPDDCLNSEPNMAMKNVFTMLNEGFYQDEKILSLKVEDVDWNFLPIFTHSKDSPLTLSVGSEDLIFDPGISTYIFISSEPVAFYSP
ncbi:hypothetical protein Tco_0339055, partial [Tanacetum coccineum]